MNPAICSNCLSPRPVALSVPAGGPRTPCPQCGIMGIVVHVSLQEAACLTDEAAITMEPADQRLRWKPLWGDIQRKLTGLLRPHAEPLSGEAIHAAHYSICRFYVQTYHLKDALIHDAELTGVPKDKIESQITNDLRLALLADLANLVKHGTLVKPPRSRTVPVITSGRGFSAAPTGWRIQLDIQHGPACLDGLKVASGAVDAWETALTGWGLA